jgi:hypothetical protein
MSTKDTRSGGKYTGTHTTIVPLAALACDIANALSYVTKISVGFIESGLRPANGHKRIKFVSENAQCILLLVRDNTSHQEVRIYATNVQVVKLALARKLRDEGVGISFVKPN